jgi:hypothetical protein
MNQLEGTKVQFILKKNNKIILREAKKNNLHNKTESRNYKILEIQ